MRYKARMRALRDEDGYTLVELAILLVIIGAIIGGVLGAQQLLMRSRIKETVHAVATYRDAVQRYRAAYGATPGDDRSVPERWGETVPHAGGIGDGRVQGSYNANAPDQETRMFWAQLRAARLVPGSATDTLQPRNPFGGIYGVQEDALDLPGLALCISNVTGAVTRKLLTRLGDGMRDTGDARAIQLNGLTPTLIGTPTPGPVPPIDDDLTYVLCARL